MTASNCREEAALGTKEQCTQCGGDHPLTACALPLDETVSPRTPSPTPPTPTPYQSLHIGDKVGSYEILSLLGRGGMGKVFRARHTKIGKEVAIKTLKAEIAEDPSIVQRFFHEAKAVNDIQHENVIDISDFGETPNGEYYLIMELLEGKSLAAALQAEAPFSSERIAHIALQVCAALTASHNKGVIHRDLKSDNIFLTHRSGRADFVKVLDFGVAKLTEAETIKTSTGTMMGTPLTMSPEQATGKLVDARSDIYSLGVILYQMATGQPPFQAPSAIALAFKHVSQAPPLPSEKNPHINAQLEQIILRCLQKDPSKRYSSMYELAASLGKALKYDHAPFFSNEKAATLARDAHLSQDLTPSPAPPTPTLPPFSPASKRGPGLFPIVSGVGLCVLFLVGVFGFFATKEPETLASAALTLPPESAPPSASPAPSTPPMTPTTQATPESQPATAPAKETPAEETTPPKKTKKKTNPKAEAIKEGAKEETKQASKPEEKPAPPPKEEPKPERNSTQGVIKKKY